MNRRQRKKRWRKIEERAFRAMVRCFEPDPGLAAFLARLPQGAPIPLDGWTEALFALTAAELGVVR